MFTLIAMGTGVAWVYSVVATLTPEIFPNSFRGEDGAVPVYFEAAALIITFISLGKWLEEKAKANTNSALQALIELQPKQVICIENGMEKTMAISDVYEGLTLKIKPGEHIAVDGTLIEGHSFVNESLLTGESIAVEKTKGDVVFSGTINQKGSFRMIAKSRGNNSRLSQIIEMVKQAQGSKAPVQKLVDKIASIFVPTIMVLSVLTFVLWMIFGGMPYINHALLSAVSVLVIACPCALGLATPTAIMVGMAKGAEHQILIRDAQSLEIGSKVDTIIFDKTGTLTEGKPTLTDVISFGDVVAENEGQMTGVADVVEHLGSDTNIYVNVEGIGPLMVRKHGNIPAKPGDKLGLRIQPENAHIFAPDGTALRRAAAMAA